MSMQKNGLVAEQEFAGAVVYVIATKKENKVDSNGDDLPCLYGSIADAEYVLSQMNASVSDKRTIRPATPQERKSGVLVHPKRRKAQSACLVEIFEDLDSRKFAISSRAENEPEFIAEFANAFSLLDDWGDPEITAIRVREFGALMVDMCCKYRGYKAEKVQTRMFLIAGDLEIPTVQVDAINPQVFVKSA